jgi:hypothetical protein
MINIKNENVERTGHWFDYELEDGMLLHNSEWNGENYTVKENGAEVEYWPVYTDKPNENDGYDIVGFELFNPRLCVF